MAKTRTRRRPIKVKKPGALRKALGVKKGQKIPKKKLDAAARGRYGPKTAARARFKKNVLTGGRKKKS